MAGTDMIGEIDPRDYDCEGRVLSTPPSQGLRPTDRFRFFLAGDLTIRCSTLDEVQVFLRQCRYASDRDQFGVPEYWVHPRFFERLRRGDCEDFALWAWRQLLAMKLDARLVFGKSGRGKHAGHAWVTFSDSRAHYLLEPTARLRRKLSRADILGYEPASSVSLRERELVYHVHEPRDGRPTPSEVLPTLVRLLLSIFSFLCLPWFLVKEIVRKVKEMEIGRWQEIVVTCNDKLPGSDDLIYRLLESGIPVTEQPNPRLSKPLPQGKRLVTLGGGIPPERIREVLRAAGDCVDFVQITNDSVPVVYVGPYRITDYGPMAELTPELRAALLSSNLSTTDLHAKIASHAR